MCELNCRYLSTAGRKLKKRLRTDTLIKEGLLLPDASQRATLMERAKVTGKALSKVNHAVDPTVSGEIYDTHFGIRVRFVYF
jgi:hypothetical protein